MIKYKWKFDILIFIMSFSTLKTIKEEKNIQEDPVFKTPRQISRLEKKTEKVFKSLHKKD